jgi:ribosomal protein L7/L12
MLKKLHELSLHVVNLVGNQKQKVQVKNAEPITANQHHKPANQSPKNSAHTQPQKSHSKV